MAQVTDDIRAAMSQPAVALRVYEGCSAAARQVIAQLAAHPAGLPSHRLVVNYGQIRKFGPVRLEREMPWRHPETVLEELYFKGIIYRAYGTLDNYRGEVLWVPKELLESLPINPPQPPAPVAVAEIDALQVVCYPAIDETILATLIRLKTGKIPAIRRAAAQHDIPWPMLTERLGEPDNPERLQLIERLLFHARLVSTQRGYLVPTAHARTWLKAPPLLRTRTLLAAWQDDPDAYEVAALGVRLEPPARLDLSATRQRLVSTLEDTAERGGWQSIHGWVKTLKRVRPDYLRADGIYDAFGVRNGADSAPVVGFESWELLEAPLAVRMLTKECAWLGLVELAASEAGAAPDHFRITELGSALLDQETPTPQPKAAPPAEIDDQMVVHMPFEASLYDRFQLERFGTWQAGQPSPSYAITESSVWEGVNAGIKVEQMLRFLGRITNGQVPAACSRTLLAWGGHFGRVTLSKAVVLQTKDADEMALIMRHADLRRLMGAEISRTMRVVPEANVALLIERLKQLGIWPAIRL